MARKPKPNGSAGKTVKPAPGMWPADRVERLPVAGLLAYPRNTRNHSDPQVDQLAGAIQKFGFTNPIIVDHTGEIIAGHGRFMAARKLGLTEVPGVRIAQGEWSDADKRAYRIWDNQSALLSEWNEDMLRVELTQLKVVDGYDLGLVGFPEVQLVQFMSGVPTGTGENLEGDSDEEGDRGALLELVDITITEPSHQVEHGDHYLLGDRHRLLCVGVIADWAKWVQFLVPGALFCPYPGVFVPFGKKGEQHPFIMVQPDKYIAGHILDRWSEVHGHDAVKKVS